MNQEKDDPREFTVINGIIDRRLNGKNKSIGNRERFLRRNKDVVKDAAKRKLRDLGITDLNKDQDISIPSKGIQEPVFGHSRNGGRQETVHPGNKDFVTGDRIARPKGGSGGGAGSGEASDSGEGEDDFSFTLTAAEFMDLLFEDLELPNMINRVLTTADETRFLRAGFSTSGNPSNVAVVRTLKAGLGRKIALGAGIRAHINDLEEQFNALGSPDDLEDPAEREELITKKVALVEEILKQKDRKIPYLDTIDLRFRNRIEVPKPTAKAVMICMMDVSGSMDQERKDRAKLGFLLMLLFLQRHYENVEVVFLKHHTQAKETDENDFFHGKETGGTIVSSVLTLADEVMSDTERFPPDTVNFYGMQASDGDNWSNDTLTAIGVLKEKLLKKMQYFAYLQVAEQEQDMWVEYAKLARDPNYSKLFAVQKATTMNAIYPAFRELFRKNGIDDRVSAMSAPAPGAP